MKRDMSEVDASAGVAVRYKHFLSSRHPYQPGGRLLRPRARQSCRELEGSLSIVHPTIMV